MFHLYETFTYFYVFNVYFVLDLGASNVQIVSWRHAAHVIFVGRFGTKLMFVQLQRYFQL